MSDSLYDSQEKYHMIVEASNFLNELNNKTVLLHDEISENGIANIALPELKLSELYSLFNTCRLHSSITIVSTTDIQSMYSAWNKFYFELVSIFEDNDSNTSWEYSSFISYHEFYLQVNQFYKDQIENYKDNNSL